MSWNIRYNIDPQLVADNYAKHGNQTDYPAMLASDVVAPFVQQEVDTEMQSSLFLETRPLQPGESSSVNVEDNYAAVVVSEKGASLPQEVGRKIIEPPTYEADCVLIFDRADLAMGVVRPLDEHGMEASDLVRAKVDAANIRAALAAVPVGNRIMCPGGKLTEQALRTAVARIEDIEGLALGNIFCRSSRVVLDMAEFKLTSDSVKDDLVRKGVIAMFAGANICKTSRIPDTSVLLTGNKLVGRCSIVYGPVVEPHTGVPAGKIGLYVRMRVRSAVAKPSNLMSILITE